MQAFPWGDDSLFHNEYSNAVRFLAFIHFPVSLQYFPHPINLFFHSVPPARRNKYPYSISFPECWKGVSEGIMIDENRKPNNQNTISYCFARKRGRHTCRIWLRLLSDHGSWLMASANERGGLSFLLPPAAGSDVWLGTVRGESGERLEVSSKRICCWS